MNKIISPFSAITDVGDLSHIICHVFTNFTGPTVYHRLAAALRCEVLYLFRLLGSIVGHMCLRISSTILCLLPCSSSVSSGRPIISFGSLPLLLLRSQGLQFIMHLLNRSFFCLIMWAVNFHFNFVTLLLLLFNFLAARSFFYLPDLHAMFAFPLIFVILLF